MQLWAVTLETVHGVRTWRVLHLKLGWRRWYKKPNLNKNEQSLDGGCYCQGLPFTAIISYHSCGGWPAARRSLSEGPTQKPFEVSWYDRPVRCAVCSVTVGASSPNYTSGSEAPHLIQIGSQLSMSDSVRSFTNLIGQIGPILGVCCAQSIETAFPLNKLPHFCLRWTGADPKSST